jgi:hypothetical protein
VANFSNFKDAEHPSAELRNEAITAAMEKHGLSQFDTLRSLANEAAYAVFHLSENFLYRQYYWRDEALKALESGDTERAKECLNEIGNSDHRFASGRELKV